jgi:Fe-S-cluster containining protein
LKFGEILDIKRRMEDYFKERSILFNAHSEFACPDSCERYGCKEPNLHVSASLVDLIAISSVSGRRATDLFENDFKIGFDPISGREPWVGRVSLELSKPCHFLDGRECSVYAGRPITCALFPEYCFILEDQKAILDRDIFRNFPCVQTPCSIPLQRREVLQRLMEVFMKETFLSDFYLFGMSPFILDMKNIAGEGLEGVPLSRDRRARVPHHRIEALLSGKLSTTGHLDEWKGKIERLDAPGGLDFLVGMRNSTDPLAMAGDGCLFRMAYQFEGDRLVPIHLSGGGRKR